MSPATATAVVDRPSDIQQYARIKDALWKERETYIPHWRECADFIQPRRPQWFITDRNRGDPRSTKIINSKATRAHQICESGLYAGMSSPARPWIRLTLSDPDLAEFPTVKQYLHGMRRLVLEAYAKSNVYKILPMTYGDEAQFGTAAQSLLEDAHDVMRAYAYPVGSYALGYDHRGVLNTFVREYQMTVRQLVGEFGLTNVSTRISEKYTTGKYEETAEVCWLVYPNPDHDPRLPWRKKMPIRSVWFEKGTAAREDSGLLRESGFQEFPIQAPRWRTRGEDYYGNDWPAATALGDIKALQSMERGKAKAIQKQYDPPLQAGVEMMGTTVTSIPGQINYVPNLGGPNTGIRPVYQVEPKVQELRIDMQAIEQSIDECFYVDLFRLLMTMDRPQMTAREIDEHHEEKVFGLGPVVESNGTDLHDPMVDRTLAILGRQGLLPEPPRELEEGMPLKIEYISVLSQAQKLIGVVAQERFLNYVAQTAVVWPSVKYKVNSQQSVDTMADMLGVDPNLVVADEDADAAAAQDAKAMMAQQQAETVATMAKGAKDLAATPMDGDTALTQIRQSLQG